MDFEELLDIPPLPVWHAFRGAQAVWWAAQIEAAGGIEAPRTAAVDRILAASGMDEPSEVRRLRLLYRQAYTREELTGLVSNTVVALGVAPAQ